MVIALILVLILACVVGAVSFVLGRVTDEVENARVSEYVEIEGDCVRYRVVGHGPPVLLVHGWLSSSRIWDRLVERLKQDFTVYSLDLKGFGDSDKPLSGYGVRRGSRILYAFCAHFEISGVGVIGHGIGGDMAVKLAGDHPGLVGGIVLVSTPARKDQVDLSTPLWLATLPLIGSLFFVLVKTVKPWRRLGMRPFVLKRGSLEESVVEDAAKPTPAAFRKTFDAIGREVSDGKLLRQSRRIQVPVLLLAGAEDQIVDPRSVEAWSENIPQTESHFIEECGHLPMIERPDELAVSIAQFLAELPEIEPDEAETPEETLFSAEYEEETAQPWPEQDEAATDDYPELQDDEAYSFDEQEEPDDVSEEPRKKLEKADRQEMLGIPDDLFEWPEEQEPGHRRERGRKPENWDENDEGS